MPSFTSSPLCSFIASQQRSHIYQHQVPSTSSTSTAITFCPSFPSLSSPLHAPRTCFRSTTRLDPSGRITLSLVARPSSPASPLPVQSTLYVLAQAGLFSLAIADTMRFLQLIGILGYLSFGDNVGTNIITMYPSTSLFVCIGRLSIVILTLCSYPLQVREI